MFKQNANTLFNTEGGNCSIIPRMNPQMERLYIAAKRLHDVEGQSALAKLLNVSPQTVNNWEDRGISSEGLLKAQEAVGCNAIWLRDGTGQMSIAGNHPSADEIIELVALYEQSTEQGRGMILDLARDAGKRGAARWIRASRN